MPMEYFDVVEAVDFGQDDTVDECDHSSEHLQPGNNCTLPILNER